MARLNYSSGLFKGNIEENRFQKFLREDGFLKYFLNNSASFGILKVPNDSEFANFRVESGTNSGTVKIGVESEAIDSNANLIKQEAKDNIALPSADTWYWMKISYLESTLEKGTVSISSNGTITGTGTEFTKLLRGGKYTFSKVKFESSLNTLEYQVVEVIDDSNMLISGASFDAESNIKFSVVGTFTPDSVPTSAQKFPFRYDSATLEFVEETSLNEAPSKSDNEYYIARVRNSGSSVSIEDKRTEIYQSKADFSLSELEISQNPLIGFEAVKFKQGNSPRDRNIVELSWGFRSSNWTFNSSLNRITLITGEGGKFKSTSDFTDGDFDGWRVYFKDGSYSVIVQSVLQSSQINLILESLNPNKLSDSNQQLFVAPNVEEIQLIADATVDTFLREQRYNYPINTPICKLELDVYADTGTTYRLKYRYKNNKTYSPILDFTSDSVGYYNESSFDSNGVLNAQEIDRTRVSGSPGIVALTLASNAFINRIQGVETGDLFGVSRIELDNAEPITAIQVGNNKKIQVVEGTISLSVDNYFNLRTQGAVEGNTFEFIFEADITLDGNVLAITEDYVNTGDVGTVLFEFNDFYIKQSKDKNLRVKFVFDGTNWVASDSIGEVQPNSWINASLLNGWTANTSATLASSSVVKYIKQSNIVFVKGRVTRDSGTTQLPAFTLPEGYRPEFDAKMLDSDFVVRTNGNVEPAVSTDNGYVNISFPITT